MEPVIIAVIGSPGSGKTFLVNQLATKLHAETILEENIPERIIENFTKDIRHMETILWFRNRILQNSEHARELKQQGKSVIMDTCMVSNELHIPTLVEGFEREVLLEQAKYDQKYLPQPDIIVFLDASEEKIRSLVKQRGRDFDTNEKFMQRILSIKRDHDKYKQENKESIVCIQRDDRDFAKEEDINYVINLIHNVNKKRL